MCTETHVQEKERGQEFNTSTCSKDNYMQFNETFDWLKFI